MFPERFWMKIYMNYFQIYLGDRSCKRAQRYGSFCVYAQPMRDVVTLQRRLPLVGCIHRMIPAQVNATPEVNIVVCTVTTVFCFGPARNSSILCRYQVSPGERVSTVVADVLAPSVARSAAATSPTPQKKKLVSKDLKCLCHLSVYKWLDIQLYLVFHRNNSTR